MFEAENRLECALALGVLLLGLLLIGKRRLLNPRQMTLRDLVVLVSSLTFGLAPFFSLYSGSGRLPEESPDIVRGTYLTLALFILGIASVAQVMRVARGKDDTPTLYDLLSFTWRGGWKIMLAVSAGIWLFRIFLAVEYGVFFYDTIGERVFTIPYHVVIVQNIVELLNGGCVVWSCIRLFDRPEHGPRWPIFLIALGCAAWAMTQGRRPILILALILFYSYCCSRPTLRAKDLVIGMFFALIIGGAVVPIFIRLRISHNRQHSQENGLIDFFDTLSEASNVTADEVRDFSKENMRDRPMIARFIGKILKSQERLPPMYGAALLQSALWAVPSSIWKEKLSTEQAEEFIQARYYHKIVDTSITWPAEGCADFGVIGGLFMGLLLGFLIYGSERLFVHIKSVHPLLTLSATGALAILLCNVEQDPFEILVVIRATILVTIGVRLLRWSGLAGFLFPRSLEHTTS